MYQLVSLNAVQLCNFGWLVGGWGIGFLTIEKFLHYVSGIDLPLTRIRWFLNPHLHWNVMAFPKKTSHHQLLKDKILAACCSLFIVPQLVLRFCEFQDDFNTIEIDNSIWNQFWPIFILGQVSPWFFSKHSNWGYQPWNDLQALQREALQGHLHLYRWHLHPQALMQGFKKIPLFNEV